MGNRRGIDEMIADFRGGSAAAAARLITVLENGGEDAERVFDEIFPATTGAYKIGFTGPPGAGKSSLLYHIAALLRGSGRKLGIIAVDPTSPFSGGALLGDRIRMQRLAEHADVFVRSLASRGSLGGISNCTGEVADLLDAFGKDLILIETVGVGQSELEIAEKTHTVVVILVPESGDGIQAMKAGLMEIGDIFVMNKADHPDAERAAQEIEAILRLKDAPEGAWRPPVVRTSAIERTGVEELAERIDEHRRYLEENDLIEERRKSILRSRVRNALMDRVERRLRSSARVRAVLDEKMNDVYEGRLSPYRLVRELEKLVSIE